MLGGAVNVAGGCLVTVALVIVGISYRHIDMWTLMAVPQVSGSSRTLISGGLYGRIRHPRYLALILASAGNFMLTGSYWLLGAFVLTTALTLLLIRVEERELCAYFGDAYRAYSSEVPALVSVRLLQHKPQRER